MEGESIVEDTGRAQADAIPGLALESIRNETRRMDPSRTPTPPDRPPGCPLPIPLDIKSPFRWLAKGTADLAARPWPSLFYGVCFAVMGWLLGWALRTSPGLMIALTAGFMLVGPFMAIGLYEVARCRHAGEACDLFASTIAWGRNFANLAIMGVALGVILALWARSSMLVIAVSFTWEIPSAMALIEGILAGEHLGFAIAWLAVGGLFAGLVFSFTVIAIPMMLDRGTDAISAMLASVSATLRYFPMMMVWAALIVSLIVAGVASFFVGLIVTGPIVGLASWHAYCEISAAGENAAQSN
jgi:uncharacterized membrane protein